MNAGRELFFCDLSEMFSEDSGRTYCITFFLSNLGRRKATVKYLGDSYDLKKFCSDTISQVFDH